MEAKRSCLKLADFKKNTAEEETTDWLAACLMPEDEIFLSNPPNSTESDRYTRPVSRIYSNEYCNI